MDALKHQWQKMKPSCSSPNMRTISFFLDGHSEQPRSHLFPSIKAQQLLSLCDFSGAETHCSPTLRSHTLTPVLSKHTSLNVIYLTLPKDHTEDPKT